MITVTSPSISRKVTTIMERTQVIMMS